MKPPICWPTPRCWRPVIDNTSVVNGARNVNETKLPATPPPTRPATAPPTRPATAPPTGHDELVDLIRRVKKGDDAALPALREMLNEPHVANALGNLPGHAQHALLETYAAACPTFVEAVLSKLKLLQEELNG